MMIEQKIIKKILAVPPIQRQSFIQLGGNIATLLFGFIAIMYISHVLGAELMGIYYLFVTYFSVFNIIGDGGLNGALVKKISEGKDQNSYFTAYIIIRILLIIISMGILFAISQYIPNISAYGLMPWIIIGLIASFFGATLANGVYGLGAAGLYNFSVSVREMVRILLQVVVVLLGFATIGLIGAYVVALFLWGVVCIKNFTLKLEKFAKKHILSLLSFSIWTFLIASGSYIFTFADVIFIGYFMNATDVGVYRTALNLTIVSTLFAVAINSTLSPKFSNWSSKGDYTQIPSILSKSITYGLIIAIPALIGGVILSEQLLYYFYGTEFVIGSKVLPILLLMQIIYIFSLYFGTTLSSTNHPKLTFIACIIPTVLNILLNIVLIPIIGIEGAALASLISMSINALTLWYYVKNIISIKLEYRSIINIIISSLIMGLFIVIYKLLIPISNIAFLLIIIFLSILIYIIILTKLDKNINCTISNIIINMGISWKNH